MAFGSEVLMTALAFELAVQAMEEGRQDGDDHQPHRGVGIRASPYIQVRRPPPRRFPRSAPAKASTFCVDRLRQSSVLLTSVSAASRTGTALPKDR